MVMIRCMCDVERKTHQHRTVKKNYRREDNGGCNEKVQSEEAWSHGPTCFVRRQQELQARND